MNRRRNSEATVSAEKMLRDAARLRNDAVGLIVLNEKGEMCETRFLPDGALNVIAVLVAEQQTERLVLEIGLQRTTPYLRAEQVRSHETYRMFSRRRVREIARNELETAYPTITGYLEQKLQLVRAGWKETSRQTNWVKGASVETPNGFGIRVHQDDHLMYRQMLLEDIRHREKALARARHVLRTRLGKLTQNHYSVKQLKASLNADAVATFIAKKSAPLHLQHEVWWAYQPGTSKGGLVELIADAFGVIAPNWERIHEMHQLLTGIPRNVFPLFGNMRVRIERIVEDVVTYDPETGKKVPTNGKGCLTAEVIPYDQSIQSFKTGKKKRSDDTNSSGERFESEGESELEREAIMNEHVPVNDEREAGDIPF